MSIQFQQAVREGLFCRLGLVAPAKAGKTMTSLKIARGLVGETGKIAVVDTENRSSNKYVGLPDIGQFDAAYPVEYNPQVVIEAIAAAESAGYGAVIIDSLTHFWAGTGGALEMKDNASRRSNENNFTAWRDVTPLHNRMVDAMLKAKLHVIATMRTKTEYVMEEYIDSNGGKRTKPVKIGLQPIQRAGMEYEFDIVGDLDVDHNLMVSGSRCWTLDGKVFARAGADVAQIILEWLGGAAPMPEQAPPPPSADERQQAYVKLGELMTEIGADKEALATWTVQRFGKAAAAMSLDELRKLYAAIKSDYPRNGNGTPLQVARPTGAVNY